MWKLEIREGKLETRSSKGRIRGDARSPLLAGDSTTIARSCCVSRVPAGSRFATMRSADGPGGEPFAMRSKRLTATIWAWRRLATWRLPHRRNGAVLLSAWAAVYSGFGHVWTHGAGPSTNGTQNDTLRHSEGLGDGSLKCGLADEWPQTSANIWSARSASSRRIVSRMRLRRISR